MVSHELAVGLTEVFKAYIYGLRQLFNVIRALLQLFLTPRIVCPLDIFSIKASVILAILTWPHRRRNYQCCLAKTQYAAKILIAKLQLKTLIILGGIIGHHSVNNGFIFNR